MPQSNKVIVKVTQRSAFDKSHYFDGAVPIGKVVPLLVDEIIPNSTINLNLGISAQLPPLATDAIAKVDFKTAAFFVPSRILYGGYESWFLDKEEKCYAGGQSSVTSKAVLPTFSISSDKSESVAFGSTFGCGSLSDALGVKYFDGEMVSTKFSLMPYLAYHKIWNDFFRAPLVQQEIEIKRDNYKASAAGIAPDMHLLGPARMNYLFFDNAADANFLYDDGDIDARWFDYADYHNIFDLRSPNYGYDYFTNAWPTAQAGLEESVDTSNDYFSISSLRISNSFQQFRERNNFAARFFEAVTARYGAHLSDAIAQRAVFLGSATYNMKNYGVDVTASNAFVGEQDIASPFNFNAGGRMGRAVASGVDNLINHFDINEPGYIFVLGWVAPRAVYGSGVSRMMRRYTDGAGTLVEMANPLLQNIGNQPIYEYELTGNTIANRVFGYTDRYADFMTLPDKVFGELRDGGFLNMFALQRSFDRAHAVTISSDFLEIKDDALDNILAYNADSRYKACIVSAAFDYKVVQPLAEYSIPSLQDPAYEHGQNVVVHRGGLRLS